MDAASDFFGEEHVPRRAITMGVGTILEARRVIMMAFGEGKAPIVEDAVEGPITPTVAASFLQNHPNSLVVLDEAAAAHLTRFNTPWLLGPITTWDQPTIRKAVIWLAQAMKKPILKLTEEDYNESGLQDLVAAHGPAYDINVDVFRAMQETITGWPGGKPDPRKRPRGSGRAISAAAPTRSFRSACSSFRRTRMTMLSRWVARSCGLWIKGTKFTLLIKPRAISLYLMAMPCGSPIS
jgi:hypothetical protein